MKGDSELSEMYVIQKNILSKNGSPNGDSRRPERRTVIGLRIRLINVNIFRNILIL